ncbi:two-component regulator propeller domain-containing protein [Roseimarinus sediminis]|uniref:two-component regulator propeller domain-containing protein n=1 Tax=Roseimarinus sediminis TaxID=1610899 RepID=UPI003D1A5BB0
MYLKKTSFILLLFLLLNQGIRAQYNFSHIAKDEGLSHNTVECITKDADGFMWFGTRNGLCRYDGYEFKVYLNSATPGSISGNRILSIAEDNKGNLWIGTHQNGLNKFNRKSNHFTHYGENLGIGAQVLCVEVLADGTVMAGSNNGIAIYDSLHDRFDIVVPHWGPGTLNSYIVNDIIETRSGEIYVATWDNAIQQYDREKNFFTPIHYTTSEKPILNFRKTIIEDLEGNLWISANIHGLCKYNPATGESKSFQLNDGLNSEVLNGAMLQAPDGKIWIASDGGGINLLDPKSETFEYLIPDEQNPLSLPSTHIYGLYIDEQQRIWVGTFDSGIACYDPNMNKFGKPVLGETIHNFFNNKSIISIYQDKKGRIWIGTDGDGLHCIGGQNDIKHYYSNPDDPYTISSNVITAIGEGSNESMLFGTYAGGLSVLDLKSGKFKRYLPDYNNKDAIHSENVWAILSDSDQQIWLGLLGNGTDIFDIKKESFKNIGPYANELVKVGHPNVMAIFEDADGDIWFGTEGNGVYIYDKQALKMLQLNSPDQNVTTRGLIQDFYQDSWGRIWMATEGNGLLRYDKQKKEFKLYTSENGLPGMITLGVTEDSNGTIWVSTYDGLARLNDDGESFTTFFEADGLSSNEFNPATLLQLHDGTLLAGTKKGLDCFNPQTLTLNNNIPRVYLTRFSVLNRQVQPGDTINQHFTMSRAIPFTSEITLTYAEKMFSVDFAALNYTQAEKCKYRYLLEGFDNEWVYTTSDRRFASYSNLENGTYVLKVQASNNDGLWGENTAQLKITVLPPFWKTAWFVSIILFVFITSMSVFFHFRVNAIRNRFQQEKMIREKRIVELEKENIETELEKLTYFTVNRNRVLVNFKNRLLTIANKAKPVVKKGLETVIEEIDKEISSDKEWKYIEPRLDKFYDSFISTLREKHPTLTLSEIKVATYVRMNLTSKEISEFMHKTIRAVENDRYRLRKKMNLDSNDSLQNYLLNLDR